MKKNNSRPWIWRAGALVLLAAVFTVATRASYPKKPFDLEAFASLPVLNGGRVKPLDTVARNSLLIISGRQTVRTRGTSEPAIAWLLDVAFNPSKADAAEVFEIDDPDVLGLMGIQQTDRRRFTVTELRPHFSEIETQADHASAMKADERGRFEAAVLNLYDKLILYQKLQNTLEAAGTVEARHDLLTLDAELPELLRAKGEKSVHDETLINAVGALLDKYRFMARAAAFLPLPVLKDNALDWTSPGQAGINRLGGAQLHPGLAPLADMGDAVRANKASEFNAAVKRLSESVKSAAPRAMARARAEVAFNQTEPFYKASVLYVIALILVLISWLGWRERLSSASFSALSIAFIIHTAGLVARMLLQGRPPVTNLYSSAIFVGWMSVLLCLGLERIFRYGIATAVSSLIGFSTLIIAHHLATQGDTLEMMRAVLDSNFWLATHVVTITIGYSSTFVSGFLAAVYVVRRLVVGGPDKEARVAIERMVYGIVCFSTFFSFLGTILGGIWADQSWGRFWGWDPKENGALMIVLWNSFILHARWGRMIEERTIMALAVFGNVVTAFSWFGVNMLGIGLHSYGFMDKAFAWLLVFSLLQIALIAAAFLPAGKFRRRRRG